MLQTRPQFVTIIGYLEIVFGISLIVFNVFFSNIIFISNPAIVSTLVYLMSLTVLNGIACVLAGVFIMQRKRLGYYFSLYVCSYFGFQNVLNMYNAFQTSLGQISTIALIRNLSLLFILLIVLGYLIFSKEIYNYMELSRKFALSAAGVALTAALLTFYIASFILTRI